MDENKKIILKDDLEDDLILLKDDSKKRQGDINYMMPSSFALTTALERLATYNFSRIFLT